MGDRHCDPPASATPVLALLTDFGLADAYVGQLKGVLAHLAPSARILDLCHEVRPQAVHQAGFFLAASLPHFPPRTLFLAVVDPGVGTSRRILCARLAHRLILAPDNGLLTLPLALSKTWPYPVEVRDCGPALKKIQTPGVSSTFHGRDLLAPLAARLLTGLDYESLGPSVYLASLDPGPAPVPAPAPLDAARVHAVRVLHADRFGNLVLPLFPPAGPPGEWALTAPRSLPLPWVRTYADLPPGRPGLLVGSQGFVELAANRDSAARVLGLDQDPAHALDMNHPLTLERLD